MSSDANNAVNGGGKCNSDQRKTALGQAPGMLHSAAKWWTRLRALLVVAFVCWHLLMLIISNVEIKRHFTAWREANPSQTPGTAFRIAEKTIDASLWYESMTGMDQNWKLFTSPIARRAPFLATRLIFDDETTLVVKSPTEPPDVTRFFRLSQARRRKFEDHILTNVDYALEYELAKRYAHDVSRRWRASHPGDPRRPVKAVLLKRVFEMPEPGERWQADHPVEVTEIATFELDSES